MGVALNYYKQAAFQHGREIKSALVRFAISVILKLLLRGDDEEPYRRP